MKYQELIVLLPCHSLEDFPTHHEGEEAQGLLAAWSSLWHPALIAAAGAPSWARIDDPPTELDNRLLVAPAVSSQELPTGFAQRAKEEGAVLIRRKTDRDEIVQLALEQLDGGDQGVDSELADEFLALGYTYLQVELLTRQMRYASNLDELHFNNLVERAAEHAVAGDLTAAREQLSASFDVLTQERDHYYAVDSYLLDITLTASTTLDDSLKQELDEGIATSLLLSASDLELMAAKHPDTLQALQRAIEERRACVVGGDMVEQRWPLLSLESMVGQWKLAASSYQRHLGDVPKVFGRRRYGLTAAMPMVLLGMGFEGAIHATLGEGRFPQGAQTKTRWESEDGAVLDAVARPPLDAARPETFLGLALKLGETMDSDHVATLMFAHWPGQCSPWHRDVRRVVKFNSPLGKFMRADEYFADTDLPSTLDRFDHDQYRSPYLRQAVIRKQADPISTSIRYWRRKHQWDAAANLNALASCVSGRPIAHELEQTCAAIEDAAESEADPELDEMLSQAVEKGARALSDSLPRNSSPDGSPNGVLLLNPQSAARRVRASTESLAAAPSIGRPVFAASADPALPQVVADAPPFGFSWIAAGDGEPQSRSRKTKPLGKVDGQSILLHNEFFEAVINQTQGTLTALYGYNTRGNRLSQQLAFRLPGSQAEGQGGCYSTMAADECRLVYCTETEAVAECRGRLLDQDGERLAGFSQRYKIGRGQRVIGLEIELEPDTEPRADPWNSYYACRFAWADEMSPLSRTVHQMRVDCEAKRFESPHYVDITNGDTSTTILTGGLPFHCRADFGKLDSLLFVRGESQRSFSLGIGVDLKNPMNEAIGIMTPTVSLPESAGAPTPAESSWLLHIDSRNVVTTSLEPLVEDGQVVGIRARLLETAGRPTRAKFQTFRNLTSARQIDFRGEPRGDLDLNDGAVEVPFSSHEWIGMEARWA